MSKNLNRFSLSSRNIRQKMLIAFQLMSILPLLVCVYLVSNYILPKFGFKIDVVASVGISIFVSLIGLLVIKEVFDRMASVALNAKSVAAGNMNCKIEIDDSDEVGELGNVLNKLTQRIRGNMDELRHYSEKTAEINIEIQKRVIVLSSLMQISTLIAQGTKFEEILKMVIEKSRFLANSDTAFLLFRDETNDLFFMRIADGPKSDYLMSLTILAREELYKKAFNLNKLLILDSKNLLNENLTVAFLDKFQMKNCLAMPLFIRGKVKAVLGIANTRENFLYNKDDIELLDIFSKQIAIAIENDILSHRIEKLEIKDTLTGLYNQAFISNRLEEEIKRAKIYQRPCAFIVLDIDDFKKYREKFGLIDAESAIKKIAILVREMVTEIDRVGRTDADEFSIILPEKNKRQAQEIAEGIIRKIESAYHQEDDVNKRITLSAGVSENPLDGVDASQLIVKAKELLHKAKLAGKNRVVVS